MKDNLINLLRWISFLPIGILSFFVIKFLSELLQTIIDSEAVDNILNRHDMGGYYFRGLWYYLNVNAISIGCSILISTQIAPNFKKIISLILAIIGVILGLVSFYKYASIQYINNESIDFYFKCFYIGSTYIFGSIAGYKFCHDEKKQ